MVRDGKAIFFVAATFEKAITYIFAKSPIRNANVSSASCILMLVFYLRVWSGRRDRTRYQLGKLTLYMNLRPLWEGLRAFASIMSFPFSILISFSSEAAPAYSNAPLPTPPNTKNWHKTTNNV